MSARIEGLSGSSGRMATNVRNRSDLARLLSEAQQASADGFGSADAIAPAYRTVGRDSRRPLDGTQSKILRQMSTAHHAHALLQLGRPVALPFGRPRLQLEFSSAAGDNRLSRMFS